MLCDCHLGSPHSKLKCQEVNPAGAWGPGYLEYTCETAGDGTHSWIPTTCGGDLEQFPGSWLPPGLVSAFVGIWQVIEQIVVF